MPGRESDPQPGVGAAHRSESRSGAEVGRGSVLPAVPTAPRSGVSLPGPGPGPGPGLVRGPVSVSASAPPGSALPRAEAMTTTRVGTDFTGAGRDFAGAGTALTAAEALVAEPGATRTGAAEKPSAKGFVLPTLGTLRRRERLALAVRDRLPGWARPRFGIEPRALAALGAVLAVAAILAVQHFWVARPRAVSPPETVGAVREAVVTGSDGARADRPAPSAGPPPSALVPTSLSSPSSPSASGPGGIVVDVAGTVRRPGVLRLPTGSRVEDALREAGGVRAGTDLTGLNQARLLVDGEQVLVGAPAGTATAGGAPAGPTTTSTAGSSSVLGTPAAPLGLNAATLEQLDALPGVGPVLAQHILDFRAQNGGFRSVDDLREVDGIGDRRFADLEGLVRP
jgi:competence protein ComEA